MSAIDSNDPCDNCARPSNDLATVQRVYLVAAQQGAASDTSEVLDDIERWCVSCRSQYPHVSVAES